MTTVTLAHALRVNKFGKEGANHKRYITNIKSIVYASTCISTLKDSMKDSWYLACNWVHATETVSGITVQSVDVTTLIHLTHKKRPLTEIHNVGSFIYPQLSICRASCLEPVTYCNQPIDLMFTTLTSCSPRCLGANLTSFTSVLLSTRLALFTYMYIIKDKIATSYDALELCM